MIYYFFFYICWCKNCIGFTNLIFFFLFFFIICCWFIFNYWFSMNRTSSSSDRVSFGCYLFYYYYYYLEYILSYWLSRWFWRRFYRYCSSWIWRFTTNCTFLFPSCYWWLFIIIINYIYFWSFGNWFSTTTCNYWTIYSFNIKY